jgi:hypothetical protein
MVHGDYVGHSGVPSVRGRIYVLEGIRDASARCGVGNGCYVARGKSYMSCFNGRWLCGTIEGMITEM